jgi:hypothetical protein
LAGGGINRREGLSRGSRRNPGAIARMRRLG